MPEWLTALAGPGALAIFASGASWLLWREHVRGDAVRDAAIVSLTASVGAFPAALKDLTTVVVAATERERRDR